MWSNMKCIKYEFKQLLSNRENQHKRHWNEKTKTFI